MRTRLVVGTKMNDLDNCLEAMSSIASHSPLNISEAVRVEAWLQRTAINGIWWIQWSGNRRRHVTPEGQTRDHNTLRAQHLENSWRRYLATIAFYRAMHFSAKRGIAIACRLSVRPSVTLVNCNHIGWNSSKIISPLVSLGRSLFATPTRRVCSRGNTPKFSPE